MDQSEIAKNKTLFLNIARNYIKREGIENLLQKLINSDFFTAPASTKYHACEDGGLTWHSLNVYRNLIGYIRLRAILFGISIEDLAERLLTGGSLDEAELSRVNGVIQKVFYCAKLTLESIAIMTLFHDLHKLNYYEKYTKSVFKGYDSDGHKVWENEEMFKKRDDSFVFGDNGSNSNYVITTYMKLTYEEQASIQNHDGWTPDHQPLYSADKVWAKIPVALYLHLADMEATYITERV